MENIVIKYDSNAGGANAENFLTECSQIINENLNKYLPSIKNYPEVIHQAMHYSIFAGGKRLRPALTIAAAQTIKGSIRKEVLRAACAIECIHTYSLIHDDLPALDDDNFRRGKPTCHKAFGEDIAILAGDALLTWAFYLLSRINQDNSEVSDGIILKTILLIAQAIGVEGMIGGQVMDVKSTNSEIEEQTLNYIHNHKTAALIKASLLTGAYLSSADQDQCDKLSSFGQNLGLAFQIVDDILDQTSSRKILGKDTGKDTTLKKATYPALYGLETSREKAAQLVEAAKLDLAIFGKKAKILTDLADFIIQRSY